MVVNAEGRVFGLAPSILRQLREQFSRYPEIERVVLFGSRARNRFHSGSDIDLAVFAPGMTDGEFARLWGEIEALPIAFKIDLVRFDGLGDARLRAQIVRDGIALYEKE